MISPIASDQRSCAAWRDVQVVRQESLGGYYRYLQNNKNEVHELLSDLLISVTSFFRDPAAFAALAEKALNPLFDKLDGEGSIRIWVIGCATGEEAYSLGILLLEGRRGVAHILSCRYSPATSTTPRSRQPAKAAVDLHFKAGLSH